MPFMTETVCVPFRGGRVCVSVCSSSPGIP